MLQVRGCFFPLFPPNIVERMPHQMNDADLHLRFWEDCLDSFGEALGSIHAGDEDVIDSTILQLRHDLEPEHRSLCLRHPQAKNFLCPGQIMPIAK